ncbi:MAG: T9SS type A sorting domain-containing protein [Saprospiraceae bacterium]|nr:T9SS type A sorting domain-containing protein [Saprospiraceae bacterium]
MCIYLQNGGAATISNNAPGCNDVPQIETACQSTSVKETSNNQANILIYPNPTEGVLNIESDNKNGLTYSIYSSDANLMMSGKVPAKGQVDVSALPNGMYFIKIIIGNQVVIKKILTATRN